MMPVSLVATEEDALPYGQAVAPHRPDGQSLFCGGVPGHGARAYRLRGVQAGAAPEREKADFDVVVAGGGTAGLAAAVYGASEGPSTLIL